MAKLTAEQKEINKAAQKIRDRAYYARRKAYKAALEASENEIGVSPESLAFEAACNAFDRLLAERDAEEKLLRAKIAELQEQLAAIKPQYEARLTAVKQSRDDTLSKKHTFLENKLSAVNAQFPDVSDCTSVVLWVPPKGYLEKFNTGAKQ